MLMSIDVTYMHATFFLMNRLNQSYRRSVDYAIYIIKKTVTAGDSTRSCETKTLSRI
jgi:hypothetical protein